RDVAKTLKQVSIRHLGDAVGDGPYVAMRLAHRAPAKQSRREAAFLQNMLTMYQIDYICATHVSSSAVGYEKFSCWHEQRCFVDGADQLYLEAPGHRISALSPTRFMKNATNTLSGGRKGGSHAPSELCGQGEAKPRAYIQIPHGCRRNEQDRAVREVGHTAGVGG